MSVTLTTHDTRFDQVDDATIAKVLGSLDGGRNVIATLERSEVTYLQAEGDTTRGFTLEYQDGSLDHRYRSREQALPLGQVTEVFHAYARGDERWRDGLTWQHVPFVPPPTSWISTWWAYVAAILAVAAFMWWLRGL
jgi:hypothetical protein